MTDLAARYPDHRRRRRLVGALAGVALLALLAWFVYSAAIHSNPDVAGRVKSFVVTSDTQAEAVLAVDRRDPSQPARCFVYAQAVNYERVGEVTVDVPPATDDVVDVPVTVKTFRRATSVALGDCRTA